ncbi:MAG: family 16 glycoside hydrolase, partial [Armatimonadota bacterium]
MRHLCTIVAIACICGGCAAESVTPSLQQGEEDNWLFAEGEWRMEDGVLTQQTTAGGGRAVMVHPAFSDFELSAELMIHPEGNGVRAAALILRATGTMTCYWVHLDSKNDNVIAVRSTPGNTWDELGRTPFTIEDDQWHSVRARCQGPEITVWLDDTEVLTCEDESIAAGYVGLGTSQGRVSFRNLQVEGTVTEMGELRSETPPYMRISLGEASGSYQAFPDVCRLQGGDLLCVFYAGYGHVSLPNDDFPRGGRVCMVRSSDEGRTWTEPEVLHDSPLDDRDPHIAQISDGTLICSFFTYDPQPDGHVDIAVTIVRSTDGGETWESEGDVLLEGFACSAPVREMPDGTLLLGVYQEEREGL